MKPAVHIDLSIEPEVMALRKAAAALSGIPEVVKVVFFGSRARGDFVGESDLDVLVVLTSIEAMHMVIGALHDIELEYDVPLSPVVLTAKEYETNARMGSGFIGNVEREGVVLYDTAEHREQD